MRHTAIRTRKNLVDYELVAKGTFQWKNQFAALAIEHRGKIFHHQLIPIDRFEFDNLD